MSGLEVLDPTAAPLGAAQAGALSPRLDTLDGKAIGILWNGRQPGPGERILRGAVDELGRWYDIGDVHFRMKPYIGNVAPEEIITYLTARSHAILTGVGD